MNEWVFLKDIDYTKVKGLAKLWEIIVSPAVGTDFTQEDLQAAFDMLNEIAQPKTPVKSFQETAYAKRLNQVVKEFETHVANSNGKSFEQIRMQAENWYDQVEKVLLGLVHRIQNDTNNAFVGGDPAMKMRRIVGIGGLMAITSPSIPVKQNVLMTIIGTVVSENALKEVYQEYKEKNNLPDLSFRQFVEELVQEKNYTWFRSFLNKVEKAIYGREDVTAYKVLGKEYKAGTKAKKGEITAITPPLESTTDKIITATLNLGNETIKITTPSIRFSNLLKGILLYVDALATPEFSDDTPMRKWTWDDFTKFYTDTENAIKKEKAKMIPEAGEKLEEISRKFIEREKTIRFGEEPSVASRELQTSPVGERSLFGNALRDYYVTHFGSEATKVKSFGISVLFNTLAEKLGIGSSIMPSVVYDVWVNANIHNLLREAETAYNKTGLPNNERLQALEQKYREALLPYGFDVEIKYNYKNDTPEITVKDYRTGSVFQRKTTEGKTTKGVEQIKMNEQDQKIADVFINATENSVWGKIRKEWDERRMYMASEPTTNDAAKAQRLTNLTKVFLRRGGREEWHGVFLKGKEPAGELVLRQLEKAIKHYMTVAYDTTTGEVRLLPNNPAYQAIMQLVGNNQELKEKLLNERNEIPVQKIINSDNEELWKKYKNHLDDLRNGGVPSAFSEQVLKNAFYTDKTQPMKTRALQALLWVCTRKAL